MTLCPPELYHVSLPENVVIAMRAATIREMYTNSEVQKPSLEEILEFNGPRMECTMESTPHSNTQAYRSTYEGGGLIQKFEEGDAEDIRTRRALAREQLGVEIPLRSAGAYSSPSTPWPKEKESETRDTAFDVQKRKMRWKRQGQGNSWDQYGDSSSAASPSASAEEVGKETHSMSEKANKWGGGAHGSHLRRAVSMCSLLNHADYSKPIEAKASGQSGLAKLDNRSLRIGTTVPRSGARLPATIVPGSIRIMNLQSGMDQSGLLQLQGI